MNKLDKLYVRTKFIKEKRSVFCLLTPYAHTTNSTNYWIQIRGQCLIAKRPPPKRHTILCALATKHSH
jgi:hypothetical protein